MKQIFRLAAFAAVCSLTLMVACKPVEPNEYQQQQEALEDVINNKDNAELLETKAENLIGIWDYAGQAKGEDAKQLIQTLPLGKYDTEWYYVLSANNQCEKYTVQPEQNFGYLPEPTRFLTEKYTGTWKIDGEEVVLDFQTTKDTLRIYSITKENLVTRYEGTDEYTYFEIYKKLTVLPALYSAEDLLQSKTWELASDSVIYKEVDTPENDYAEKVIDTKVNQLPQHLTWTFSEEAFTEADAEGNVLHEGQGQYAWRIEYNHYLTFDETIYPCTELYKALGIEGKFESFRDFLYGDCYISPDYTTLCFVHKVEYLDSFDPYKNPVYIILTFKAK